MRFSTLWQGWFKRKRAAAFKLPAGYLRRFIPQLEWLETRLTPTGNITITGVSEIDDNYNILSVIKTGESIGIQTTFTTTSLPSNASYRALFMVNGLILSYSNINLGAGLQGTTGNWILNGGPFIASPGINQVTVILDPDHSVVETTNADNSLSTTFNAVGPAVGPLSYTVAQIRAAYGINSIPNFGSATADGSGQTIALVDAGNEPTILSDLDSFDQTMSLTTTSTESIYQQYGPASSFVNVYNQYGANITADIADSGTNGVPAEDPTAHWETEESLDVEWAHAIAPGAKIDIIEVTDDYNVDPNLLAGDALAASLPGVSAISNTWSFVEWNEANGYWSIGETAYDSSTFVTPSGHTGVTFLAASGDNGANDYWSIDPTDGYYPTVSPNVVSVGGTQLTLNNNTYDSETAWSYPTPASTVDYGSPSYTQQGSWTSQSGGFSGTYSTASPGADSSASWTLAINPANNWAWGTEVSATWIASPSNATNATYTIYDGTQATGTVLGTVTVDQTKAPVGTSDGNAQFQELGVFFPTTDSNGDGTLTVVLNANSANGTVVADALGTAQAYATSGGPSVVETEPAYQSAIQNTGYRTTPDVSMDASENSAVYYYVSYSDYPGLVASGGYGTSLACPCWAGLIAIANQGRVADGGTTFNSPANPMQTVEALYAMPASDFISVTTGYNGFSAGPGYDFLTGLGTPIANLLIPDLVNYGVHLAMTPDTTSPTAGRSFNVTVSALDQFNNAPPGFTDTITLSTSDPTATFVDAATGTPLPNNTYTFTSGDAGVHTFTVTLTEAGSQTVTATDMITDGSVPPESTDLTVNPAAAAQLAFFGTPSGKAHTPLSSVQVDVLDTYGNLVTTDTSNVSIAVKGPESAFDSGTTTQTASGGVANFTDLVLNTPGNNYILTASDTDNSVVLTPTTSSLTVGGDLTSTTITASKTNPTSPSYGELLSFTATVANTTAPSLIPTGTVTFDTTVNGVTTPLSTLTLTNGAATLYTLVLGAGSNSITATYNPVTPFLSSTTKTGVSLTVATANTSLSIKAASGSPNPATFGEPLTIMATLLDTTDSKVLPIGGKVTILNGTTPLGSGTVIYGSISIIVSSLGASSTPYALTASYSGPVDSSNGMANYAASKTTASLSQTVNTANTSTAVSVAGNNPSTYGESLTLTATVTDTSDATVTPTRGTVTFFSTINNVQTSLGSAPMSNGKATLNTTAVGAGSTIIATYNGTTNPVGGQANFASSTSGGAAQTVNTANTSTALSVSGNNPSTYGESLALKATITDTSDGTVTPTGGIVTFYNTINSVTTTLGTTNMKNGLATLNTTAVGAGNATITASYNGTTNAANGQADFASSTSTGATQTVNTANTSTTVTAAAGNPSSPTYGETLKFTTKVTDTSDPSVVFTGGYGTATFYDGRTKLATIPVWNGTATLSTNQVFAGSNSITAIFNGYNNPANGMADFAASAPSPAITQTVGTANTSVALVAAAGNTNPSTYGVPLTFTATVTDTSDKTVIPQMGTVTLYNGSAKLAAFPVINGIASFTLPNSAYNYKALAVSSTPYSITATYTASINANGVVNFNTSTSSAVSQTVNTEASTSTQVTPDNSTPPLSVGQLVLITATITNTASGSVVTPVGTVTFTDGMNGPVLAVKSVINGVATLTTTHLSKGTHDIWAFFSDGANNFMASSWYAVQTIL